MQLVAGALLDGVLDLFESDPVVAGKVKALASQLSHFDLGLSNAAEQEFPPASAWKVVANLLQRGAPTKLNFFAAWALSERSNLLAIKYGHLGIKFSWEKSPEVAKLLFRSLHVVDPRLSAIDFGTSNPISENHFGSAAERNFFYSVFPNVFAHGADAILQLVDLQRKLDKLLDGRYPNDLPQHVRQNFAEQSTDFSVEFPYAANDDYKGVIVEIDGSQHKADVQQFLDRTRDESAIWAGFHPTVRVPVKNLSNHEAVEAVRTQLRQALQSEFTDEIRNNFAAPLFYQESEREVLELALIPFAISRIQRTLIHLLGSKSQKSDGRLTIAVIERDVPCACLAIKDLKFLWNSLAAIAPEISALPEITLHVFCTKEFEHSAFQFSKRIQRIEDFSASNEYDVVLDVSVLQRKHCTKPISSDAPVYTIRSVYGKDETPITHCGPHIQYAPLCDRTEDERWVENPNAVSAITYLLKSFFRKSEFRPGQIPILSKALQARSVIGLLPTGGGKSITYQLAALLQPGICLVIDPIRSLMADQVDGLIENDIHVAQLINSTLKGKEKEAAIQRMARGETQFVFISPERLQMDEFRGVLRTMHDEGHSFSYCVIDEAHCVSEWGHDFRTAYLQLGTNAYRYCLTGTNLPVPLFGLTATASFDVLADIQRELSGHGAHVLDDDALVRFESTVRPEIQFVIEEVTLAEKSYRDPWKLKEALGAKKRTRIEAILVAIPEQLAEFISDKNLVFDQSKWDVASKDERQAFEQQWEQIKKIETSNFFESSNGGLIFCPHKSGQYGITNQFKPVKDGWTPPLDGVYDVFKSWRGIKAGFFMGAGDEQDHTAEAILTQSMDNQKKFKKNELNLMVATKAFGMGIDKPNIRYTIHMNYPGSIESFVQESGRAGRDRGLAISYLLINRDENFTVGSQKNFDHDKDVNLYFHRNSFKGIQKELAILDELLTEIYLPDRTAEIEALIEQNFDVEVNCSYWERGAHKRLYVNQGFNKTIGYIDLTTFSINNKETINQALASSVLPYIVSHIKNLHLTIPSWEWIQQSDKEAGIERVLKTKPIGEKFSITLGFINNQVERVKTLTVWLQKRVHPDLSESTVKQMRGDCNNADEFIEKLVEKFTTLTNGKVLDFEAACIASDKLKSKPEGHAFEMFCALFNGYRNKMDTERAIYRLTTLGIIDDYTVDFNAQTFTLTGIKKKDPHYESVMAEYLKKFFSGTRVKQELRRVKQVDEDTYLRKCLNYLVEFVYKTIKEKRANAIDEMKKACLETLEKGKDGNLFLREYIDLYFNSKYARLGYQYTTAGGTLFEASLSTQAAPGKALKEQLIWSFIEHVNQDPTGTEIENTKHLRGACVRLITNQPQNFVFRFLNSFCLFVLEWRNERLLREAIDQLILGFEYLSAERNPTDASLEKIFRQFIKLTYERNPNLDEALERLNIELTFDMVMLSQTIAKISNLNSTLQKFTNKLIPDGI